MFDCRISGFEFLRIFRSFLKCCERNLKCSSYLGVGFWVLGEVMSRSSLGRLCWEIDEEDFGLE